MDTFIFPILFSYRHCLELSLKHIYYRFSGNIQKGGHNLLSLWDAVKKEIIDDFINNSIKVKLIEERKKERFIRFSLYDVNFSKIRLLLKELQEANQTDVERQSKQTNKQIDQNAEVWRYLISNDNNLFFSIAHNIDYLELKDSINYLYDFFDFVYDILDNYLSS